MDRGTAQGHVKGHTGKDENATAARVASDSVLTAPIRPHLAGRNEAGHRPAQHAHLRRAQKQKEERDKVEKEKDTGGDGFLVGQRPVTGGVMLTLIRISVPFRS